MFLCVCVCRCVCVGVVILVGVISRNVYHYVILWIQIYIRTCMYVDVVDVMVVGVVSWSYSCWL